MISPWQAVVLYMTIPTWGCVSVKADRPPLWKRHISLLTCMDGKFYRDTSVSTLLFSDGRLTRTQDFQFMRSSILTRKPGSKELFWNTGAGYLQWGVLSPGIRWLQLTFLWHPLCNLKKKKTKNPQQNLLNLQNINSLMNWGVFLTNLYLAGKLPNSSTG